MPTFLKSNAIKVRMLETDMRELTVNAYSDDYNTVLDEAKAELNDKARPELSEKVKDMAEYQTVIIGYPKMEYIEADNGIFIISILMPLNDTEHDIKKVV